MKYEMKAASSPAELTKKVQEAIDSGMKIWGAPLVGGDLFCQAVVEKQEVKAAPRAGTDWAAMQEAALAEVRRLGCMPLSRVHEFVAQLADLAPGTVRNNMNLAAAVNACDDLEMRKIHSWRSNRAFDVVGTPQGIQAYELALAV